MSELEFNNKQLKIDEVNAKSRLIENEKQRKMKGDCKECGTSLLKTGRRKLKSAVVEKRDKNVLRKRKPCFTDGPLHSLKRCVHDGNKIMVWVSNQNVVRGICTGFIVAFDKFWNLVMTDVDETYQKNISSRCPYLEGDIEDDEIPEAVNPLKIEVNKPSVSTAKDKKGEKEAGKMTEINPHEVIDLESGEMMNLETEDAEISAKQQAEIAEKRAKRVSERKQKKLLKKTVPLYKRHIPKLFIKGNNVIFIRICD